MGVYKAEEVKKMIAGTGCSTGRKKMLIELYQFPTKEALTARKAILGNHIIVNREEQFELRLKLVEIHWGTRTKLEQLVNARKNVENKLNEEERNMKPKELDEYINKRNKSNALQHFQVFEKYLLDETREMMGYSITDEKDDEIKPTLTTDKAIEDHIYKRVKAYYNNEFHYDLDAIKKEKQKIAEELAKKSGVETIGV